MYPAAQLEVCEIGLAIEPYRLCVCVLDFGVVDDRERESIVRLPALDEFRVLKRGQAVDVQEGMRVSERKCVHAASPARYTDQHKRQSYNYPSEIHPAHRVYFDPGDERLEIPKST